MDMPLIEEEIMERDIDYVIAVAECRSISQAAEVLYISQPSLSRYLSNLENELGFSLFVRTINGTELTEAGKIYLKYAKEIKLLRGTMEYELREFQRKTTNRIRVGMTLNSASLSAYNVAEKVKKRYPGCDVEMYNIMSKDIEEALREGKYDFAIGPALEMSSDFEIDIFAREPYILIVPERSDISAYAEKGNKSLFLKVDLGKLPKMDFILQEETTSVRKGIDRLARQMKYPIVPRLLVTSSPLAIQAAESGLGCCIVATGHLAYVNRAERLNFYQVGGDDLSCAAVLSLRTRAFSPEENYCIACIKAALRAGEKEIFSRLGNVGKLGV